MADAIAELSAGHARLAPMATESLSKVRRKASIKVFVLVTCPFCPTVARHAYRAAIGSPLVTTEVIDSSVFQELSMRHSVMGVPKVILNDNTDITGAVDEVA
ncbi:MAG: thioredoxin family protein, partial [Thermoplasmata archaeon]|nr:thioredoxin family protein [Thermoplasmata archaeon]